MWLKLSTLVQMVLFIVHKAFMEEYRTLIHGFIIRSAIAATYRLGPVLLYAAILLGNPLDKQSTAAQKGFPLPSGLLNLGREFLNRKMDQVLRKICGPPLTLLNFLMVKSRYSSFIIKGLRALRNTRHQTP
ncbi:hypothetical protein QFZ20_000002 [Flavobacterium sp. W4I14]|nr:hypothetical protein [Flavobacterium sp. W4I14]